MSRKSTKKLSSPKHLTREDYGPYCEIATKEPPTGYQQKSIDAGTFPGSLMVVNQKRFCEMTNAVAENVNVEAEEPIDLLNGLDADETAFVDGADADADAAELVDIESAGENAMEHIQKHVNQLHPGKYSFDQIREEVIGMVRREELRMKEDCVDHDWSYRKGRMW